MSIADAKFTLSRRGYHDSEGNNFTYYMPLIKIKRKGCKSFEQHIVPGWSLPQRTYCEQHQRVNRQNFQNLVVFDDHVEIVTSKEAIRIDENGLEITSSTVMEAPSEE